LYWGISLLNTLKVQGSRYWTKSGVGRRGVGGFSGLCIWGHYTCAVDQLNIDKWTSQNEKKSKEFHRKTRKKRWTRFLQSFEVALHNLAWFLARKYEQVLHLPEEVAIIAVFVDRRARGRSQGQRQQKSMVLMNSSCFTNSTKIWRKVG
jgi:cell division protein FtsB